MAVTQANHGNGECSHDLEADFRHSTEPVNSQVSRLKHEAFCAARNPGVAPFRSRNESGSPKSKFDIARLDVRQVDAPFSKRGNHSPNLRPAFVKLLKLFGVPLLHHLRWKIGRSVEICPCKIENERRLNQRHLDDPKLVI